MVTVVLEGGVDALKAVKESAKNGIPAVVLEGTGKVADILAFAHYNCECVRYAILKLMKFNEVLCAKVTLSDERVNNLQER